MRIFVIMKSRLNLTIDSAVLAEMKEYSEKKNISLSRLIEDYFAATIRRKKKSNLLNMVDALPPHRIDADIDLKAGYYSEKYNTNGR